MTKHGKKMLAPILVAVILAAYYAAMGVFVLASAVPAFVKALAVVVPAAAAASLIYVSIERIREISGGEEDDIGKY
jgi:hypothetical protein